MTQKTTSLGFDGASLIGLGPDSDAYPIGEHTDPAAFVRNKQQHTGVSTGQFGQSIYDDDGRGIKWRNRRNEIKENARKYIAHE